MSGTSPKLYPGKKVTHVELGEGVVISLEPTGFVRVFFQNTGERQVQPESLSEGQTWIQQVISGLKPATPESLLKLKLAIEAEEIPLMDSSATLTSAKIDLLPHQVVLVHRVSNAQPRRFMVADEVGLGKTIEAALIVRELAFRGELERALVRVRELENISKTPQVLAGADVKEEKSSTLKLLGISAAILIIVSLIILFWAKRR